MGNEQSKNKTSLDNRANEVKWFYQSNKDPWSKSEEEEWTEYTKEESPKIEQALSLSKETVEVGDYIVYLKEKIQVHKQQTSKQRPLKRVDKNTEPSLREVRFSLPPSKPIAVNEIKKDKLYPFLMDQFKENSNLVNCGWDLVYGTAPGFVIRGLINASIEGILQEGSRLGQENEARWMVSILESHKKSKQDKIGEVCVQLFTAETFLYKVINQALREEDTSKANTLGPFCVLLYFFLFRAWRGLLKFPRYTKQVFRGSRLSLESIEIYKEIAKKEKPFFAWDGFTSTSKSRTRAEVYGNTLFIISLNEEVTGADISDISTFPLEEEVLLNANSEFLLEKIEEVNGKYLIYLRKQIITFGDLLKLLN